MQSVLLLALLAFIPFGKAPDPPEGYAWSSQLPKPPQLTFLSRAGMIDSAGWYDYAVATVGDNWCCSRLTGYAQVQQPAGSGAAVRFSSSFQDPSCGWLSWRRGPYASNSIPENQRGPWKVGCPLNAGAWPNVSMPIIPHHGGDCTRWQTNGWAWSEATYFSGDGPTGQFYRRTAPTAPLWLDGITRPALPDPPPFAPDVTLLSAIPNVPVYVSLCWVDQFGRESQLSDPLLCPATPGANCSVIQCARAFPPPQGACGARLYAGSNPGSLHRQIVLNRIGGDVKHDFPLHLSRFYLHALATDTPSPSPGECRSWLNPIQQDVEAPAVVRISHPGQHQLYCPLILTYDPSKFGRKIGDPLMPTKLVQNGTWASSALLVLNQRDTLLNTEVVNSGCASIATSDYSGGQAFSNALVDCSFNNSAVDGYGILVDDNSSVSWGNHTCSELLVRHCIFTSSRPVKIEGMQSAKIRFDDRNTFNCNGLTRYPNEVCTIEHFTSNAIVFDLIEGVNGLNCFRSLCGMYSREGVPILNIRDVFCDRGCSVGFSFSPNTGGVVDLGSGDKLGIYQEIKDPQGNIIGGDRNWFRLLEAPNSYGVQVKIRGLKTHSNATALAYNLNSMTVDLDQPIKEIISPTASEWTARGLYLNFGNKDWSQRPSSSFIYGFGDKLNTLPRRTVYGAASVTSGN